MKKLLVNINNENIKYNIEFCDNISQPLQKFKSENNVLKTLFVIDENVYRFHQSSLDSILNDLNSDMIIISSGEQNKTTETLFKIIDKMSDLNLNRTDAVVCLGGGVTGDIGALAASLFKRGTKLIQIPTTLLSMLDSSVGGKTGIDYRGVKNLLGSFYSSDLVIINSKFLETLDKKELQSGFFEGVKHSLLIGESNFNGFIGSYKLFLDCKNHEIINNKIYENISIKLDLVSSDPFETNGKRKQLNYGHTFGHAIETLSNFSLPHGVCVGYGMIFSNILSSSLGVLKSDNSTIINDLIKSRLIDFSIDEFVFEDILELMLKDKKNSSNEVQFILLKDYGIAIIEAVSSDCLKTAYELFIKYIKNEKN